MKKLWQKTDPQMKAAEDYCFGDTVVVDNKLIVHDAIGSIAHGVMLADMGILTKQEFASIKTSLLTVIDQSNAGLFCVESGDEDVHTKIEMYLTEQLGEAGKKIHTGRSRNDQVLVDLRLYTKVQLLAIFDATKALIHTFYQFAKCNEFVPMPGYTHMQKAMPSSIGMWAGSFAESLLDDNELLKGAFVLNDQSPLGSGAAYGISLPIDRQKTSDLLGFSKVQNNALYAQVSRGKSHAALMHTCAQIMLTLARFAADVLLFTTSEFNFFRVDESLCTGSSIMPQKKNLDVLEMVRARTHAVCGYETIVQSVISGLPSGYNADIGETKQPFIKTIETTKETVNICRLVLESLHPNIEALRTGCSPQLYATHAAYQLVQSGIPFRDAYVRVGKNLGSLPVMDPLTVLKATDHAGGSGNLNLQHIPRNLAIQGKWWNMKRSVYVSAMKNLGVLYE